MLLIRINCALTIILINYNNLYDVGHNKWKRVELEFQ